ncbi:translocation protein TolB [Sphingopyxis sp. LC81]|uniref:TolB family protein n=1 Tax=Sphingopyxis sp. LC81 TaxID=1502850 RepID=UPI00050E7B12|nr:PD40 domain-containing protein [Sphingopyxis sp. LC81]KGB52195.1 translocation protein TolB [Sphingopyxis sp. LC81]
MTVFAFALSLLAVAPAVEIVGEAELFGPGIASTDHSEIRLTISADGRTALWFSRDRPGGPGGYDIWISRRVGASWAAATPVSFNSPGRDFDPAFSRDGRFVYFCSDRPGGMGKDDLYRVAVTAAGFGTPENLGPKVNSAASEYAPMLSPDGRQLLFSSDRPGGAGRHDLYTARSKGRGFAAAVPLPGAINTPADEFDASFLADNRTLVFARAPSMKDDRIDLFAATSHGGRYDAGMILPLAVNDRVRDSYGPMLDWSAPDRLTFSGQRGGAQSMELYRISYRLVSGGISGGQHGR